jgi:hypothetical protein
LSSDRTEHNRFVSAVSFPKANRHIVFGAIWSTHRVFSLSLDSLDVARLIRNNGFY